MSHSPKHFLRPAVAGVMLLRPAGSRHDRAQVAA